MRLLLLLLLSSASLLPAQGQTTLSLTSRGDLASSFGSARKDVDRIGTRASFGIELSKRIKENRALLVGLEYAIEGTDYGYTIRGVDPEPELGIVNGAELTGAYRYDFIALPIGCRLYGADKKWRFFGQASLIPMAYLRTIYSQRIEGRDRVTQRRSDLTIRDIHVAISTGAGIERVFGNGWSLGLQPTVRVHLNSLSDGPLKERLWTGGLQLNIGRQLNRVSDEG